MSLVVEALGLVAGTLVTCAALPRVASILREPARAAGESIPRNALMVSGNILWVAYGLIAPAPMIGLMCAIGAFLNGLILLAAVRVTRRTGPRRPPGGADFRPSARDRREVTQAIQARSS